MTVNSLSPSVVNSLSPDQARKNRARSGSNLLHMSIPERIFEKVDFEKNQQMTKKS